MTEQQAITEVEDLTQAIRDGVDYGAVNVRNTAVQLREFYGVDDAITDEEIEAAHVEAMRADFGPVLVFTRGDYRVIVAVKIGYLGMIEDEEVILQAARDLTEEGGEAVNLERVSGREEGDDILRAFRMPEGAYVGDETDARLVQRFGDDVARYRIVTQCRTAEAA
ncbi:MULTISPECIES: hypothetical protein [Aureimonas]|uniref:Uncharacterized protein n=1 Tax=Aureimonas pseudogalii TaxID=1744844 RepID=A0A7W6H6Y8_9HYPH|nr:MULTISPECIES: hypothetical protein [Aureimonas]MBB3999708.1 hypothetical protein [Aureimonas pseudogalii]